MLNWTDSPLAQVLKILIGQGQGRQVRLGLSLGERPSDDENYLVTSYKHDFSGLWNITGNFLEWLHSGPRTIVLIWDETPVDAGIPLISIREHLGAFDWAVALTLLAARFADGRDNRPQWRLIIADLASERHSGAVGVRLFNAFQQQERPLIPWVRAFTPEDFPHMLSWLETEAESHPEIAALDLLKTTWASALVNPARASERHAIVNLVAPRVLIEGMGIGQNESENRLATALVKLMDAVELVPKELESLSAPWVRPARWKQHVDRFVVIDDLADLGWSCFLQEALGAEADQLDTHLDAKDWRTFCDIPRSIVFLDLRLFTRWGTEAEKEFFREMLEEARKRIIEPDEPPDQGFYAQELDKVERLPDEGGVDTPGYYVALTLLPKLMSLTYPTLPIVIFSSTGRREIAEALRPFGNVVLGFEKPRFFGNTTGFLLEDTKRKFETALEQALTLAEGRELCHSLSPATHSSAVEPSVPVCPDRETIEIFTDESKCSETNRFAVGGIIVRYPPGLTPQAMEEELHRTELRWTRPHRRFRKKYRRNDDYAAPLTKLAEFFEEHNVQVGAFGLFRFDRPARDPEPSSPLLIEDQLDLFNRNMIMEALEAVLFDVVPQFASDPASIAVHLPTRLGTVRNDPTLRQRLIDDWAVRFRNSEDSEKKGEDTSDRKWQPSEKEGKDIPEFIKYYAVSHEDGRSITRSVLLRRPTAAVSLPVKGARAVELQKDPFRREGSQKRPQAREIHYLADWIARFAAWETERIPKIALRWFERGFLVERDASFSCWLAASRAGDEQEFATALHSVYQARKLEPGKRRGDLGLNRFVQKKAGTWVEGLGPATFKELCDLLLSQPGFRSLYIPRLPDGSGKEDLVKIFEEFGEVKEASVRKGKNSELQGKVTMADERAAGRARRASMVDGVYLRRRRLKVCPDIYR